MSVFSTGAVCSGGVFRASEVFSATTSGSRPRVCISSLLLASWTKSKNCAGSLAKRFRMEDGSPSNISCAWVTIRMDVAKSSLVAKPYSAPCWLTCASAPVFWYLAMMLLMSHSSLKLCFVLPSFFGKVICSRGLG